MTKPIVIATRNSPLALWQAEYVKAALLKNFPELTVRLCPMQTEGDRQLTMPLANIGGKGLFLKELEQALLDGRANIAVHSLKDVTVEHPKGLLLAAFCQRGEVRDAFVSNRYSAVDDLPKNAVIGTSSYRRSCQLLAYRSDLEIRTLRGNVPTRLKKLDSGEYDAIILAGAGLIRLNLQARIQQYISPELCLPAVGQGTVVIQCCEHDVEVQAQIQALNCPITQACAIAERTVNQALGGGCQVPIAAYAVALQQNITLRALVGSLDGKTILTASATAALDQPVALGKQVADVLIQKGANAILREVFNT